MEYKIEEDQNLTRDNTQIRNINSSRGVFSCQLIRTFYRNVDGRNFAFNSETVRSKLRLRGGKEKRKEGFFLSEK